MYRDLGIVEGQLDDLDGLALLEIAEGRPAQGVRLLAIADRELRRLGVTAFVPDEMAAREAGWAQARAALGEGVEDAVAAAADVPLEAVVDELLADPKLTGDG